MSKATPWTPCQLRLLRELYPTLSAQTVAREVGRTVASVYLMAFRLELRKATSEASKALPKRARPTVEPVAEPVAQPLVHTRYLVQRTTDGLPAGIRSATQYRLQG